MKKVDYIVVGCGLASIAFCEQLQNNNKTYIVFDDASQKSSIVAAGMYNPVILKRFTEVWKATKQLSLAMPYYKKLEQKLGTKLDYKIRILRRFASIEEQNLWFTASDKKALEPYLSTQLIKNNNNAIDAPFGFGEVLHTGRVDTKKLITAYKESLRENGKLIEEPFNHQSLQIENNLLNYEDITAKHIVFAEGFGVKKNPFFNRLPLNGNKGEILTIKAPNLKMDFALKSSIFLIPIGNDLYHVGATYNREDKSKAPTEKAKAELIQKLNTFLNCDFEVVKHVAGIRPTVKDRRPLVGRHSKHHNLYLLNGLGSRGVMTAPYVADKLFNLIEANEELETEIDINRFN